MNCYLGDVCLFYSGTGFPVQYQGKTSGELPFYKVGDITNNVVSGNTRLSMCSNYVSRQVAKELNGSILPANTIVFAKIGEALKLNRRAITNCDCLVDNNVMGIAPNPDVLRIGFFFYFMKRLKMQDLAESTTVPSVRKSKLEKVEICVPTMEKQIEVERILNATEAIIRKRKLQLSALDNLINARFVEMFGEPIANPMGWPVKRLKDLSVLITNGNTPKGGSENYVESGITFLRSQNVWRNRIELDDVAFIDEGTHESMKKSSLHHDDILITKTGRINTENSSLGRAALFKGEDNSANINGHVYLVRLDGSVVPEFVVTILTGEAYRRYIRRVCVGGIDKRQINVDQVEEFPIIIPPYEQQKQFAAFVAQIDKSKSAIQKSLDETQLLFDSLIQQFFG